MKKTLLFILCLMITGISFSQYQGFENWTSNSVLAPDDYESAVSEQGLDGANAVIRSTDAQIGTYSIRLETVTSTEGDTIFGYFISGDPDSFTPGQATATNGVDSIIGYYKYDIMAGDSVLMIAAATFMSTPTGGGTFYITSGQQSTWKRFSYPIQAATSDSILFGFATGDPMNDFNGKPGTWIQFDNIQLKKGSTTSPIENHSFENWSNIGWEEPTNWTTSNQWAIGEASMPIVKSTDKYAGTYAMEVNMSLNSRGDTLWGFATNGYMGDNGPDGGQPFTGSPDFAECYYKYVPSGNDTAYIGIDFMQNGNVIAQYGGALTAQASYMQWSESLNAMTPDSVLITVWAGKNIGSKLTIDNIDFVFPVGIAEGLTVERIVTYPNPATDELNIRFSLENNSNVTINLIDITGKTLITRNMGNISAGIYRETFNTSEYASGIYFIEFNLNNEKMTERFIIK